MIEIREGNLLCFSQPMMGLRFEKGRAHIWMRETERHDQSDLIVNVPRVIQAATVAPK